MKLQWVIHLDVFKTASRVGEKMTFACVSPLQQFRAAVDRVSSPMGNQARPTARKLAMQ